MCLGFVNETSDLLVLHLLLIARVYIYTCKLKSTTLALTFFTELVINRARIEKWLALETNALGWVFSLLFFFWRGHFKWKNILSGYYYYYYLFFFFIFLVEEGVT